MSEQDTPPQEPKKRADKVAEEKARLRAELEAFVNRVPDRVNSGSIQTTRQWVGENKKAVSAVTRKRASRRTLREELGSMQAWHAESEAA